MDDGTFDKALFDFYVNHKVRYLKRKLTTAGERNVKCKRSGEFPASSTFTRYSGKLFSKVKEATQIWGLHEGVHLLHLAGMSPPLAYLLLFRLIVLLDPEI